VSGIVFLCGTVVGGRGLHAAEKRALTEPLRRLHKRRHPAIERGNGSLAAGIEAVSRSRSLPLTWLRSCAESGANFFSLA
jgi:hypothetical protein